MEEGGCRERNRGENYTKSQMALRKWILKEPGQESSLNGSLGITCALYHGRAGVSKHELTKTMPQGGAMGARQHLFPCREGGKGNGRRVGSEVHPGDQTAPDH